MYYLKLTRHTYLTCIPVQSYIFLRNCQVTVADRFCRQTVSIAWNTPWVSSWSCYGNFIYWFPQNALIQTKMHNFKPFCSCGYYTIQYYLCLHQNKLHLYLQMNYFSLFFDKNNSTMTRWFSKVRTNDIHKFKVKYLVTLLWKRPPCTPYWVLSITCGERYFPWP